MQLLQKTIRGYLVYSAILLLIAIPAFYFSIKSIVVEDADEHLEAVKANVLRGGPSAAPDVILSPSSNTRPSEVFVNRDYYDSVAHEVVPYRLLLYHFTTGGRAWLLTIRYSMLDSEDLIESIVEVQAVLLILLLSGLILINRMSSKKLWRPFYHTLERLRQYKVERHQPLEPLVSDINEFNDLNGSLKELTERVHDSYLAQKEFTENAAHEIQTPLAIFQSKLELLMQTTPLNEEQAELISDLANASQRLGRLNKSLTLLTRIENQQFQETHAVPLLPVLEKNLVGILLQAGDRQIAIEKAYQGNPAPESNPALLEILVSNLLHNAFRHNVPGGAIRVTVLPRELVIQNTGKPGALDPSAIFQRFYKDSKDPGSIGLGLQIVRQICALYGWSVTYLYWDQLHTFRVCF